jgi:MoxR-like ATPase
MKSEDEFFALDKSGNQIDTVECQFDKQGTCRLKYHDGYRWGKEISFKPKILFCRGDKKQDINSRLISSLTDSVKSIRVKLTSTLEKIETQRFEYEQKLESPFITAEKAQLAISGIVDQINRIKLRITDCERLEELCR